VPNRIGRPDPRPSTHRRTGSSSRRGRDASTTRGLREYRVGRVSSELGVAGRRVRSLRLRANDRLPKTQKNAAIVQQSRIIGHYSPKPVFDGKCAYESWLFCVKIARTLPHHFPGLSGKLTHRSRVSTEFCSKKNFLTSLSGKTLLRLRDAAKAVL
jgi:hypothetical protein